MVPRKKSTRLKRLYNQRVKQKPSELYKLELRIRTLEKSKN